MMHATTIAASWDNTGQAASWRPNACNLGTRTECVSLMPIRVPASLSDGEMFTANWFGITSAWNQFNRLVQTEMMHRLGCRFRSVRESNQRGILLAKMAIHLTLLAKKDLVSL